jgi:hypothetical protein
MLEIPGHCISLVQEGIMQQKIDTVICCGATKFYAMVVIGTV